ncbi:Lin1244/Lin1753 domain-containing protein [Enterococcus faecalis]|uniref:Lin1244/Lin1753 domain-containing protein n=1 Tax=Enterococcus faecalis TaxID=1351 RepID=UPI003CFE4AB1
MARPLKQGIDYFSLSVDFLRDIKVRKIKRACGPHAVEILLCLLGNIYRETGYYIGWDEDTMFLVADEVGAKEGLVEETVNKAIQVGFFNQEKFNNYKILTSSGIQKRYLEATKKRKEVVISDIYLVNDTLKEKETLVNGANNTQSKVKESKVNKSKVKESREEGLKKIYRYYESNGFGTLAQKTMQDFDYWITDFEKLGATQKNAVELIIHALGIAIDRNKRNYGYANAILKDWEQNKYLSVKDVEANDMMREQKKTTKQQKSNTGHSDYDDLGF